MSRFLSFLVLSLTLTAQTPPLDKPPQDIEDALRARINQFYDYHVAGKHRLCEQLIAEESKDDFYVLTKAQLKSYKISNIEYSDNFTKAKAIILGTMPVLFPMVGARVMEQPFASYWTRDNGVWFWYYNKKDADVTPFGHKASPGSATGDAAGTVPEGPNVTIEAVQSAIKIDRTRIDIVGGAPQTVKVTNTLPGPATLTIDSPLMPMAQTGVTATFDKKNLQGKETATLTLAGDPKVRSGPIPLRITVTPTNQVLDIMINVTR